MQPPSTSPLSRRAFAVAALLVAVGAGGWSCGGGARAGGDGAGDGPVPTDGGAVTTTLSPAQQRELTELQSLLDTVKDLDAAGFASKYHVPFVTDLGYDPLTATGLERIQASSLALSQTEQSALAARGFVTTNRKRYPSFVYGYQTIYSEDLPVYVSADSILYAVHESFEAILNQVEQSALLPALDRLLRSMDAALAAGRASDLPAAARQDVAFYVSVARSLLRGSFVAPVAGGDATAAERMFTGALAASGWERRSLFGVEREMDMSQFKPRGRYVKSEGLQRYFRAMTWLGRIDFRLLETQKDHSQRFHRRQLEGAYAIRALMDPAAVEDWTLIDRTVGAFAGEPDNMTLPQLDALLADLGLTSPAELGQRTDAEIAQAVVNGRYGTQRISSHIMVNGLGKGTMPLSSTFLLLGQRYVLDSHVFSNVVFDRVKAGTVRRLMPNPLDVGFAALRNDHAGLLLGPELATFDYASDLASMRVLADAHPSSFWETNLYNHWLTALRTLSPTPDVADPSAVGLPRVAATEPWGRRLLSTQLASWAELRHDTLLYVKQSYTSADLCEYPDAYVEPYPELFARLAAFAARGSELLGGLKNENPSGVSIGAYFNRLKDVLARLERMAKAQRSGAPHSAEDLAFVNQLTFKSGCGTPRFDGWYAQLFFDRDAAIEEDPIIADVHTQPTDEYQRPVGKVLHVGTGHPRTMVVTVETCSGPRAYVGVVSSYFEKITEDFKRLTDEEWAAEVRVATPPDVPWMAPFVER